MHLLYPKNSTWRWLGAISNPRVRKIVLIFLMTVRPLSWACGNGTEMLLILKKKKFSPRYIQIWQSKEMSHDFVRGQSVAETCYSHRLTFSTNTGCWFNVGPALGQWLPMRRNNYVSPRMSHHQRSQRSCLIRFLSEHTITLLVFSVYSMIMINVRKTGCSQSCDNQCTISLCSWCSHIHFLPVNTSVWSTVARLVD